MSKAKIAAAAALLIKEGYDALPAEKKEAVQSAAIKAGASVITAGTKAVAEVTAVAKKGLASVKAEAEAPVKKSSQKKKKKKKKKKKTKKKESADPHNVPIKDLIALGAKAVVSAVEKSSQGKKKE